MTVKLKLADSTVTFSLEKAGAILALVFQKKIPRSFQIEAREHRSSKEVKGAKTKHYVV